jgi:hypothetical protein
LNDDRCVTCGAAVPEGRQVCPDCEARAELTPPAFARGTTVTLRQGGGWLYTVVSEPYDYNGTMCLTAIRKARRPAARQAAILRVRDLQAVK